jgi:DNA-binding transcriptional regulator GbsR (MarR family)
MSRKKDWEKALANAELIQEDIAKHLGISKQSMSLLVKKMIQGQGLMANDKDKDRWEQSLDYIEFKKSQLVK